MTGSAAEERIRAKAEAMLRQSWPSARIIHELVLEQGGCRIDLAAVRPDGIVAVEVKSERDTLGRLKEQIPAALKVAGVVNVCIAPEQVAGIEDMLEAHLPGHREVVLRPGHIMYERDDNPNYVASLHSVNILVEEDDGFRCLHSGWRRWDFQHASDLLHMLWAEELREVVAKFGPGRRARRFDCIALAVDAMSGREVRRAVCAALMKRSFPRADAVLDKPKALNLAGEAA